MDKVKRIMGDFGFKCSSHFEALIRMVSLGFLNTNLNILLALTSRVWTYQGIMDHPGLCAIIVHSFKLHPRFCAKTNS